MDLEVLVPAQVPRPLEEQAGLEVPVPVQVPQLPAELVVLVDLEVPVPAQVPLPLEE